MESSNSQPTARRHHFIPRFLLRGFKSGDAKKDALTYEHTQAETCERCVTHVGVADFFYADGQGNEIETQILTKDENKLSKIRAALVAGKRSPEGSAKQCAELVGHLVLRSERLRSGFASASEVFLGALATAATTPDFACRFRANLRDEDVVELLAKDGFEVAGTERNDILRLVRIHLAMHAAPERIATLVDGIRGVLDVEEQVKRGHLRAMRNVSVRRTQAARWQRCHWSVLRFSRPCLVLGDVVALGRAPSNGDFTALACPEDASPRDIFLPLAANVLLRGTNGAMAAGSSGVEDLDTLAVRINEASAELSRAFFVSAERNPDNDRLATLIGRRSQWISDREARSLVDQAPMTRLADPESSRNSVHIPAPPRTRFRGIDVRTDRREKFSAMRPGRERDAAVAAAAEKGPLILGDVTTDSGAAPLREAFVREAELGVHALNVHCASLALQPLQFDLRLASDFDTAVQAELSADGLLDAAAYRSVRDEQCVGRYRFDPNGRTRARTLMVFRADLWSPLDGEEPARRFAWMVRGFAGQVAVARRSKLGRRPREDDPRLSAAVRRYACDLADTCRAVGLTEAAVCASLRDEGDHSRVVGLADLFGDHVEPLERALFVLDRTIAEPLRGRTEPAWASVLSILHPVAIVFSAAAELAHPHRDAAKAAGLRSRLQAVSGFQFVDAIWDRLFKALSLKPMQATIEAEIARALYAVVRRIGYDPFERFWLPGVFLFDQVPAANRLGQMSDSSRRL